MQSADKRDGGGGKGVKARGGGNGGWGGSFAENLIKVLFDQSHSLNCQKLRLWQNKRKIKKLPEIEENTPEIEENMPEIEEIMPEIEEPIESKL